MTARGKAIVEVMRSALASLDTLDPADQDTIVSALIADLRARRPMSIAPLSVLPLPTEPIKDPRGNS